MAKTRAGAPRAAKGKASKSAEPHLHPDTTSPMRPDVGTQPQFRKKKAPRTYRYDSSLSPALDWDGQNGARELGEWLVALIDRASSLAPPQEFETPQEIRSSDGRVVVSVRGLRDAVDQLKRLGTPFLDDDSVWDHLAGTTSAPFEGGQHQQVAVKVLDDRGNELLVVKGLP